MLANFLPLLTYSSYDIALRISCWPNSVVPVIDRWAFGSFSNFSPWVTTSLRYPGLVVLACATARSFLYFSIASLIRFACSFSRALASASRVATSASVFAVPIFSVASCFASIPLFLASVTASFNSWFSTVTFGFWFSVCAVDSIAWEAAAVGAVAAALLVEFIVVAESAFVVVRVVLSSCLAICDCTTRLVFDASAIGIGAVVLGLSISSAATLLCKLNIAIIPNIITPTVP